MARFGKKHIRCFRESKSVMLYQIYLLINRRHVLRALRKAKGLTREELALKAKCSPGHITSVENGRFGASVSMSYAIYRALYPGVYTYYD